MKSTQQRPRSLRPLNRTLAKFVAVAALLVFAFVYVNGDDGVPAEARARALMIGTWQAHDSSVTYLSYANDDKLIVSFSMDRRLRISELDGTSIELPVPLDGHLRRCAVSPDGRQLAAATSDGLVHIIDLTGHAECVVLEHSKGNSAANLFFSPDGKRLGAFCANSTTLFVWNTEEWSVEQSSGSIAAALGGGRTFAFGPDPGTVVTSTIIDDEVEEWTYKDGRNTGRYRSEDRTIRRIGNVVVMRSGTVIAATWHGRVAEWDRAGNLIRWFQAHPNGLGFNDIAVSTTGKIMATVQSYPAKGLPSHARVWDRRDWSMIAHVDGPRSLMPGKIIDSVALDSSGRSLACGMADGSIRTWKIAPKENTEDSNP